MKIKTSELIGAALDWAVAKCEGRLRGFPPLGERTDLNEGVTLHGVKEFLHYSTNWARGGPIIEGEGITVICWNKNPDQWGARKWLELDGAPSVHVYAPTPLIAAMRCYVASKLGDEVDVPEELTK